MSHSLAFGRSAQDRELEVTVAGLRTSGLRVLVIGGQHGDETLAMEAVETVRDVWPERRGLAVAFIPCVNPDGRAAGTRRNAAGIDLNRDHQRLETPECRALHSFARAFQPQLVVDVHTFKGRRRSLLQHGYEWGADVMLEIDNHPDSLLAYPDRWSRWMTPVIEVLSRAGVFADRYMLMTTSGKVRTSSADLLDARNGLAASIGASGALIEGREPTTVFGSPERTRIALAASIQAVINAWAAAQPGFEGRDPGLIHLDAERLRGPSASAFTLTRDDHAPRRRELPARAFLEVVPARPVVLPTAYGVPRNRKALLRVLARHGFEPATEREAQARIGAEQVASVVDGRPSKREFRAARKLDIRWMCQAPRFESRAFLFTDVPHGDRLATLLEPGSRFGLHRYPDLELPVPIGGIYDVARGLAGVA